MALYEYECPVCGKEITSRYREQFIRNTESHLLTHYNVMDEGLFDEISKVSEIIEEVQEGETDD